jgi:hypothetical protein
MHQPPVTFNLHRDDQRVVQAAIPVGIRRILPLSVTVDPTRTALQSSGRVADQPNGTKGVNCLEHQLPFGSDFVFGNNRGMESSQRLSVSGVCSEPSAFIMNTTA